MKWDRLTSQELSELDRNIPVFINLGAVEQHGPHLPVSTDHKIGSYFLDEIDRKHEKDILILPSVKICCSAHHMDFQGTLTVSHETLIAYVSDICASVRHHEFTKFFIFNSHGGNLAVGQMLVEKLGARYADMKIGMLTWWQIAREALTDIQESGFGGVGHACEFETSILLAIDKALVRGNYKTDYILSKTYHWAEADMLQGASGTFFRSMNEITAGSGVAGAPKYATVKKGHVITQAVTQAFSEILTDIRAVDFKPFSSNEDLPTEKT